MNYPPNWDRPYYGPSPFYFPGPPQAERPPSLEELLAAKSQIETLEEAIKKKMKDKDDKDKTKTYKPPVVSLGTMFAVLCIFSIPTVLLQLAFLDWARYSVAAFLVKAPLP